MAIFKKLYIQVLIAMILGIFFGYLYPQWVDSVKPLADLFIKSIKMLIAPIIFLTIVNGIISMSHPGQVGRLSAVAIGFFLIVTTIALVIGMISVKLFHPGVGMNIHPASLPQNFDGLHQTPTGLIEFILNIVPSTFLGPFAEGQIIQVLFLALFFSFAMIFSNVVNQTIIDAFYHSSQIFFKMIQMLMFLAPIAAFAAMAYTVGHYGFSPLIRLFGFVVCYYLTCLFFMIGILGSILYYVTRINVFQVARYFKEEMLIILGTASSETVLSMVMQKLEKLGCERSTVGLVIPMGYSFNLAGTAIYLTMAALFIAQATNTHLSFINECTLLALMIISSKGAAGVSGSGFVVLTSSLAAYGMIPVSGVFLILGVDKFLNEGRALINMLGNVIATLLISYWRGHLNIAKLDVLKGSEQHLVLEI